MRRDLASLLTGFEVLFLPLPTIIDASRNFQSSKTLLWTFVLDKILGRLQSHRHCMTRSVGNRVIGNDKILQKKAKGSERIPLVD